MNNPKVDLKWVGADPKNVGITEDEIVAVRDFLRGFRVGLAPERGSVFGVSLMQDMVGGLERYSDDDITTQIERGRAERSAA